MHKKKRQMDQCNSPFLSVTPRWPVKIRKSLPQTRNVPSSFDIISSKKRYRKLSHRIIMLYGMFIRLWVVTLLLLGKILIACNYGKLVKALKQSFILFIYLFWLTTNNLTLCWFSISLSCFVNAVNDGLASGSFCQQFIMIWYLRKIISSLFVISPTNFSGIVRVAFFLTFLLFSSRTECQKVKNKWLFKLFKHIIKTSSLILVWYYLVTLSSLKLRNKIWLVLYTIVIFLKYIKTFTICHPRVVA